MAAVGSPVRDALLLYDGVCGFCNRTVQLVLRHDHARLIRFAPLQGDTARTLLHAHPELIGTDSLVLVERDAAGERISVRSDGALRLAACLGWPWRALGILTLVPRPLRDWGYDRFATVRYRLFGRFDACPLPAPEVRARFLP